MSSRLRDISLLPSAEHLPESRDEEASELIVRVSHDGHIQIEGERAEVEAFLEACAAHGLLIDLDCLSWCG